MLELMKCWEKLWSRIPHCGNIWRLYGEIVTRYSEPHRVYHNLWHIVRCLEEFGQVRHLCEYPEETEIALFAHDVIYEFRKEDNEERSAAFMDHALAELEVAPDFRERVFFNILATKHTGVPADPDGQLAADVDLSIQGAPEVEYLEGERRVHQEYAWVPPEVGRPWRKKVLSEFLGRDRIYLTDHFREKYEAQARKNLKASIRRLEE